MDKATKVSAALLVFENPLLLESILKYLPLGYLTSCRLVCKTWNDIAISAIRKALKSRLLFCADSKCTANLKKFINVFQDSSTIPYSRAILILDHLPCTKKRSGYEEGEFELLLQLSDLFTQEKRRRPSEHCSHHRNADGHRHGHDLFRDVPPRGKNGETVKLACEMFNSFIDNLIMNLTVHQENVENIEYWLQTITFPNLTDISFHITRSSPEDISTKAIQIFFNTLVNLKSINLRKLTKKGDSLFSGLVLALTKKTHLNRLTHLSIESLTDDNGHLELLLQCHLSLERLSLIYLGGEVRFIAKMDFIKQLLHNVSGTLQHLYTHLPLFTLDQNNFCVMPNLKTVKIEKVYREYSVSQAQLFGFDFKRYFPNIEKVTFKDYDLWKNMQLKTIPLEEVIPCFGIREISLPDLCFDAPLMERYFRKFPHISKLSIIVSYVSRYQKQCSFCMVYAFLPQLKELHVALLEVDVATCDDIFIGMNESKCKELIRENRQPRCMERGLSIILLQELETLKITSVHEKRVLGITDRSVKFGFMRMASLRRLTIAPCLISANAVALMGSRFDVTILSNLASQNGPVEQHRYPATVPETQP